MSLDEIARDQGFQDAAELHRLVCEVPIGTPEQLSRFEAWKDGDGTKDGLLDLLSAQKPGAPPDEWTDEVRDWYFTNANGLDCAGAHEAQHFEDWYQAIREDPGEAVDALVSTARYLGHGNDDMLAEVVALLRQKGEKR